MKNIVEFLSAKGLIFRSCKEVAPKELGSRKKVEIYICIDLKGYYATFFVLRKKSRVLAKEIDTLEALFKQLETYVDSRIPQKYLLIEAPLCSKAQAYASKNGWVIWHEFDKRG